LLVANTQDSIGAVLEEIKACTVVGIGDESPLETLLFVNLLLALEDGVVEVVLQLLVGVVDAKKKYKEAKKLAIREGS
jgi:hypothetical protein